MSVLLAAGWARSRSHGGVGRADDPEVVPRDHEQHRLLGLGDEAALRPDPVLGHDDVDALAGVDVELRLAADQVLHLVGPDPGRVDDDAGTDLEVALALEVARAYADDAVAVAQEAGHLGAGRDVGAVVGGGAGDGHHQPGVVDLAVVVADRAVEVVGPDVRRHPGELLAEDVLVLGHAHVVLAGHRHGVVERDAGADVGALPRVLERVEERHRPDQVGREPGEQQAALLQRLLDQREVEHLEVAQAAVHQLGRARRRAGGEVALLDQPDLEPARHRVERRSDADDPAADDQHVELTGPELLERVGALIGIEGLGERHGASLSGARRIDIAECVRSSGDLDGSAISAGRGLPCWHIRARSAPAVARPAQDQRGGFAAVRT